MTAFLSIVRYTLKQHIRHRVYLTIFLFGVALLGGALIISSLAVDEQVRMLMNLGLAGIEFIALFTIVFVTVGLILEEIESKSIYLILSHPIERWQYVLGRFVGTLISIFSGMLVMVLFHLAVLFLHGWTWETFYPIAIFCSFFKIALIGSLALVISLITTSTASSMTLTAFLWIMGHFSSELKFLGEKSASSLVKFAVNIFYYITPDFALFNYRDFHHAPTLPTTDWFGWLWFYGVVYIGTMLFLSSWLFSKREV